MALVKRALENSAGSVEYGGHIFGNEREKKMSNYTIVSPDLFVSYKTFPDPTSGDYDAVIEDIEVKEYIGTVFEAHEITFVFYVNWLNGSPFYAEQTFLYSDEVDSDYDIFMKEIVETFGHDPVYLGEIKGLKGTLTIKVEKVNGKSNARVMKFIPSETCWK